MLHAIRAIVVFAVLCGATATAAAPRLNAAQYQFMQALRDGQLQKARDLLELARLNPNDFDGQPFVRWMFEGDAQLNGLNDETFDYVFKELRQPFNTPQGVRGQYTTFAMLCSNTAGFTRATPLGLGLNGLKRAEQRIKYAIANGASAKHLPNLPWPRRRDQPLPRCVQEYLAWRNNPLGRSIMLSIIDILIQNGADPQYDLPIATAAGELDEPLLHALHANGARLDHVFPVFHESDSVCGHHRLPPNTIVAKLPEPRAKDIPKARPFLEALHNIGIDIMEPQTFVRFSVNKCRRSHVTLIDRALASGNTAYAKMVLEISKAPRGTPLSNPPAKIAAPATPSTAAGPIPRGSSRIVTSSFNVRDKPALNGALMSTLGPNSVFEVEDSSPDGQWTRINVVPVVRGWANTAVILRSSTPNRPN